MCCCSWGKRKKSWRRLKQSEVTWRSVWKSWRMRDPICWKKFRRANPPLCAFERTVRRRLSLLRWAWEKRPSASSMPYAVDTCLCGLLAFCFENANVVQYSLSKRTNVSEVPSRFGERRKHSCSVTRLVLLHWEMVWNVVYRLHAIYVSI